MFNQPGRKFSRSGKFDFAVVVTFAAATVFELVVFFWQTQPIMYFGDGESHVAKGHRPPTGFALRASESGEQTNLVDQLDHVVWLVFWGPWNESSRKQMPELNKLYNEKFKDDPRIVFFPVVCEFPQYGPGNDSGMMPATETFFQEAGITLPVYLDETGDARRAFNVRQENYPTNVVLDPQGIVQGIWSEFYPGLMEKEMLPIVERCLQQVPAAVAK